MNRKQIVILGGGTGGTMTANRLRRHFEAGEADEGGERDLGLEPGQGGAEAEVVAGAEGQVAVGVGPGEVEAVGIGEHRGVAVGRAEQRDHLLALSHALPTHLHVGQRGPGRQLDGAVEAEQLVHRVAPEPRVVAQ